MHSNPKFWENDETYAIFTKDRFLEYTEEHIKEEFEALDYTVINKLKKIPVLFATEHEQTETKIGKITDIKAFSNSIHIYFKIDSKKNPLIRGTLKDPALKINFDGYELYRSHWAIKEVDFYKFYQERESSLLKQIEKIKQDLDALVLKKDNKNNKINIVTLYAPNGSGKTRISKHFQDEYNDEVICYNAFVEDLFYWDNTHSILKFDTNSWIFELIERQGIQGKVTDNFKDLTDSKIEPDIDFKTGAISFYLPTFGLSEDGTVKKNKVKISRGEESIFIWSVFYTYVEKIIDILDEDDEELVEEYKNKKYLIIDDPVSSMDDSRIITVALKIASLIEKSKNKFSFLITTHHPLFFNVLFNKKDSKNWHKNNYTLSKINDYFSLKPQANESPFAYHHFIISEIEYAIDNGNLRKYHFNLFRTLLEKCANFFGYETWKDCLKDLDIEDSFFKLIDHYSHDRLSDLEYSSLIEKEIDVFTEIFYSFLALNNMNRKTNNE
jgi:hypothetical protein